MDNNKPKIIHFQRKPNTGNYSLEFIFQDVRNRLKDRYNFIKFESKYVSRGFFKRLFIIFDASFNQGEVNHVTGDIHYLTLGLKKSKTILTILDCGFLAKTSGIKFYILKFFWLTLPLLKTSIITTISEATKKDILRYAKFPSNNIRIIPVAISPQFKFRRFNEFNKSCPTFLHVGMAPNKNILNVIKALEGLNVHYIIIGKLNSNYTQALENSNISFENYFNISEEELVNVYQKIDGLIFASTFEGFGMPILEAQAMGKPVITSNISSMPEVAGEAACFVDPFDINSIRNGVLKIINDDDFRNDIIQKGFENIKRFDAGHIANLYASVYDEVLAFKNMDGKKFRSFNKIAKTNFTVVEYPALTDKPIILQLGTEDSNNWKRLVQATEGLSIRLHIVGDLNKDEYEFLKRNSHDFTHSISLNQNEIQQAFINAHIVFLGSTSNNFNKQIIQAQAIGRPVIVSSFNPAKEILGESVCYINPYIPSEIRHAILNILNANSFRNSLIENGLKNAEKYS